MVEPKITGIRFVLEIPLYEQKILFILGANPESAARIALNTGCCEEVGADRLNMKSRGVGVTIADLKTGWFVIYLKDLPRSASEHGTLIHEIFHVTESIMDAIGMPHKEGVSSEAYAYLIGWISANVFESLWEAIHATPIK